MLIDHRYVDDNRVAERYLRQALLPHERASFEAHLVDCDECTDRVLLAEMFAGANGRSQVIPAASTALLRAEAAAVLPLRARFVARYKPWQLVVLVALGALLLLAVPTAYFLWQLRVLSGVR
jgi:hypothetical protein